MRILSALIFVCLLTATVLLAQKVPKRIFLSPKSNITTAEVAEGFSKYCPNIIMTQNQDKAEYLLEASETVGAINGTTNRTWHFALMNPDGDVLMTTQPEFLPGRRQAKQPFESVCKFINK
jgi:hypothetical protein